MDLIEGNYYLVGINSKWRIAKFNGFGEQKGWGGMDWSGDSGHSTDSWMHEEIEWYLPLNKISLKINGDTKQVDDIDINRVTFD